LDIILRASLDWDPDPLDLYKQGWKLMLKNCGPSMKWKELAVNRTLLVMIKRRANTFL